VPEWTNSCRSLGPKQHAQTDHFNLTKHTLNVDDGFDFGYYLMFEPDRRRIEYRSGLRMYEQGGCVFPYAVEMERPFTMTVGVPIDIEIYIQGTLGLLYVNKDTAFGFRMYNHRNRRIGVFSTEGGLHVNGLRVLKDK